MLVKAAAHLRVQAVGSGWISSRRPVISITVITRFRQIDQPSGFYLPFIHSFCPFLLDNSAVGRVTIPALPSCSPRSK